MKAQEEFPILLDADSIMQLPDRRLPGMEAAPSKLLWRSGDSVASLTSVEPGATLTLHRQRYAQHHAWVLEGSCTIMGRILGPGAYVHIPPGAGHDVVVAGPEGATIYYVFVDEGPYPQ